MAQIFYLHEVVQFAIEKEKESEMLYQKLASKTWSQEAKNLFENLLQQERKHEEFYTKMLAKVDAEQTPGVHENEEYKAYMQELIAASRKARPFSDDELADPRKAIDCAMGRERDSIVFYIGLQHYVRSADQGNIEVIIKEEARHLALLANLKKNFK